MSSLLQLSCTMSCLGCSQNQALSVQPPNLKQGDSIVLKGPAGIMMRSLNTYILVLFPPSPNTLTPYGIAHGKQPSIKQSLTTNLHLWFSYTSRVHLAYFPESKSLKKKKKYWQHIITVTLQHHSTLNDSCLDPHRGNQYFNLNVELFNHFCVGDIWFSQLIFFYMSHNVNIILLDINSVLCRMFTSWG